MLLEYSIGVNFKDYVVSIFKKINPKFKAIGWAIILLSFFIIIYYVCIVGWDLNYFFFSFTKAWGSNPNVFFNVNFLHSTASGIQILIPVLLSVIALWFITWLISSRDLSDGIGNFTRIFVPLLFVLGICIAIYNLFLPGAYIGYMKFFQPDWSLLYNVDMWLSALVKSYLLCL